MRFAALLLLLTACSHAPLSPEQRSGIDQISAASFFGNTFTVDVTSRALIRSRETVVDAASWKLDQAFADSIQTALAARAKTFVPFTLDPAAVEKALGTRESRWKRVEGKQSQALMDLLFNAAERQGIRYFFLATPEPSHELFPTFRGVMGTACGNEGAKARAFVYYFSRFTLWDVSQRKKLSEREIDPSLTAATSYADCSAAAEIADPVHALEEPAKRTLDHLVQDLLMALGW